MLSSATEQARRRGDRRLGTDHVLLRVLPVGGSPVTYAFGVFLAGARSASDALDVASPAAIGLELETLGEGPPAALARRLLPLGSGSRAVVNQAIDQAHRLKRTRVDTTHLLLALLCRSRPDSQPSCSKPSESMRR